MKGFKGFNSKLQCTPEGKCFQYEVGKTYEEQEAVLCKRGFHFCEHPLDIFGYYAPTTSRFAEVEALADVTPGDGTDTKHSTTKIRIGAELTLSELINAAVRFVFDRAADDRGDASATGNGGGSYAPAPRGAAYAADDRGAASATGDGGTATASLGNWIVVSEWKVVDGRWSRVDVKAVMVDGATVKADTFYMLKDGQLVACE